ncbi:Y-box-binding protein 2-like [Portunus trituberculatus]|uniref:Y-box-binding protein 2-like n=1 Tax=Portunus trituberculatus TaxID=210409 RepID=UPI001E1CCEBF|nr:Y-box-binding protein 2-like [Portunus trituberculatus]
MAGQQHQGKVKWFNYKRGYGFIRDHSTKTDVFAHFSGLKRSLQKRLLREGDKVVFTVHGGDKGPEARDTVKTSSASHPKPPLRTWDVEAKISACIGAAKVLAGTNTRRLQVLIPLLLTHNGLPTIRIPPQAFGTLYPNTAKPPRVHQPSRQDKVQPRREDPQEEVETVEEDEEGEDELVDVEGSDSGQPLLPIEPPPAEEVAGWKTPKRNNKNKNSTSTTPAAEAVPTPQPSPQSETTDQEQTEEPHTLHYLLRKKNPGTKDTPPNKITFSDIIQKGYVKKNHIDSKKQTSTQKTVRQLARHGGLAT